MFNLHISILIAYSVLLASTVLLIWSLKNKEEVGSDLGKIVGSIVFVFSVLSILCIGFYGIKYWSQGNFETPRGASIETRREMMRKLMPRTAPRVMERRPVLPHGEAPQNSSTKTQESSKP